MCKETTIPLYTHMDGRGGEVHIQYMLYCKSPTRAGISTQSTLRKVCFGESSFLRNSKQNTLGKYGYLKQIVCIHMYVIMCFPSSEYRCIYKDSILKERHSSIHTHLAERFCLTLIHKLSKSVV